MSEFRKVFIENMPSVNIKNMETLDVHLSGGRLFIISAAAAISMFALFAIADGMFVANQLKQQELKIREKQLELEQRRFALDSIMYYNGGRTKQK